MDALCLIVAGALAATLPGEAFTLAWTHSVQKTGWEERYRIDGERLRLVGARVEGSGAGMEVPPEAKRDRTGWTWSPQATLPSLTLAGSTFGGDYLLCAGGACRPLADLVGHRSGPVELRACRAGGAPRDPPG
ncbi:MAG TPA: DUF1850 domain-containing protein [Casimicrobiaceae bacterium]|nr:DUF1850 domain-containing protein [Casimicrobiaceae bacterium]